MAMMRKRRAVSFHRLRSLSESQRARIRRFAEEREISLTVSGDKVYIEYPECNELAADAIVSELEGAKNAVTASQIALLQKLAPSPFIDRDRFQKEVLGAFGIDNAMERFIATRPSAEPSACNKPKEDTPLCFCSEKLWRD